MVVTLAALLLRAAPLHGPIGMGTGPRRPARGVGMSPHSIVSGRSRTGHQPTPPRFGANNLLNNPERSRNILVDRC